MSLRAGPGNLTGFLFCACCFSPALVLGAEAATARDSAAWILLDTISVEPGANVIARIRQDAADLEVAVAEAGAEGDSFLLTQDSADERYGTEIVVLTNPTAQTKSFQLHYLSLHKSTKTTPAVDYIAAPTPEVLREALALTASAQAWRQNDAREDALAVWQRIALAETSPFQALATVAYLQGLRALARNDELLAFLAAHPIPGNVDSFEAYYLTWLKASALLSTGQRAEALALLQFLADNAQVVDPAVPVQLITLRSILNELGYAIVMRGFDTSDATSMRPGYDLLMQALALIEPLGDPELTGNSFSQVALAQAMAGDWDAGLNSLYVAEQLLSEAGSLLPLVVVKSNIAFHYTRRGLIREAQNHYRDALQLLESAPEVDVNQFSTTYARLGLSYKLTGAYAKAENYFNIAAELYTEVGAEQSLQDTWLELGELHRLRGRHEEALQTHLDLVDRIHAETWNDGWLRLKVQLVRDYLALGRPADAQTHVDQLLLHRQNRLAQGEAASRVPAYNLDLAATIAEVSLMKGDWDAAVAELAQALSTLDNSLQEGERQLELTHLLSVAQYRKGQIGEAVQTSRGALALIEANRNQVDIRGEGASWNGHVNEIATHLVGMLLEQYLTTGDAAFFADAFAAIQHTKAINLRQSRQLAKVNADRERLRGDLQVLWQTMVDDKRALLAATMQNRDTRELEANSIRSEEAYNVFRMEPAPEELPPLSYITLAELQAMLGDTTALLFNIEAERGFGIGITSSGFQVYRIPGADDLAPLIDASIAELASRTSTGGFERSFELSRALFGPLTNPATALLIEADGMLGQIPFAALPVGDENFYTPLALGTSFTNVPTLSEYFSPENDSLSDSSRLQAAVLADPEFGNVESPFELAAVDAGQFDRWRGGLERLPFTAVEATELIGRFPASAARLYSGSEATIDKLFLPDVRHARILHLASHGFISPTDPEQVGFLLAGDLADSVSGFLTTDEIRNYDFGAELVVISGCETAVGEVLAGEYMMGLSRAFLAQGAKSVLATLWPVSDRATAIFMGYFYEELLGGQLTPALALQRAQARMFRHPTYRHPLYWAAFTLTSSDSYSFTAQLATN